MQPRAERPQVAKPTRRTTMRERFSPDLVARYGAFRERRDGRRLPHGVLVAELARERDLVRRGYVRCTRCDGAPSAACARCHGSGWMLPPSPTPERQRWVAIAKLGQLLARVMRGERAA